MAEVNNYYVQISLDEWNAHTAKLSEMAAAIADLQSGQNRIIGIVDIPLSVNETAKRLQISRPTLYKYVNAGKIKATRTDKRILFMPQDIADYMRANRV